jgi:outer membrane receptor protein involved in Fe transport
LFNAVGEVTFGGFQSRLLLNYAGPRISDVGANGAPDIIETGRTTLDLVFQQRIVDRVSARLSLENLTDEAYVFTQGIGDDLEEQRNFKLGRTVALTLSFTLWPGR